MRASTPRSEAVAARGVTPETARDSFKEGGRRVTRASAPRNGRGRLVERHPDLLDSLSAAERDTFLAKCTEVRYPAGSLLCAQGNRHVQTYLVRSGLIRTFYVSPGGREFALAFWSGGDLVGGPNFFDENCNHLWSVQAVEDSVVLAIRGSDFKALATTVPALAERVFDTLSFKMRWFSLLVQTLGTEGVTGRLARLLCMLADLYGVKMPNGTLIRYHFGQEDLANMIGVTRQWVSSALSKLQREGVIDHRQRNLLIVDLPHLRELASAEESQPLPGRRGAGV